MDDVAVVSSTITLDNEESQLMVIGPSRMEYNRVVALMEFMSQAIETVYGNKE
jgi:heat-inducible transcriptional repressor